MILNFWCGGIICYWNRGRNINRNVYHGKLYWSLHSILTSYFDSESGNYREMPSRKDSGPPPAKPKPEDLIAEFKTKFEEFSSDTKLRLDQVTVGLGNVRETQLHLEEQNKICSLEEAQNIKDFTDKLSQQILEKLAASEQNFKHEFLRLEGFLQEGRFYMKMLDCVLEIVHREWLVQNFRLAIGQHLRDRGGDVGEAGDV